MAFRGAIAIVVAVSAGVALGTACGGSSFTSASDDAGVSGPDGGGADDGAAAGDDGGAVGTGDGGGAAFCPATRPQAGTACAPADFECEYGTDPLVPCDQSSVCNKGVWAAVSFANPPTCPTPTPTENVKCPLTYAAGQAVENTSCSDEGLTCSYPQGICACARAQAGAGGGAQWHCPTPGSGCPATRPRLGSSCAGAAAGVQCDYGTCTLRVGVAEKCGTDGHWQVATVACPL
jgi:hypothetical protein